MLEHGDARSDVTKVFTGFGEHGVRAETVAERVAAEVRRYLVTCVPSRPGKPLSEESAVTGR